MKSFRWYSGILFGVVCTGLSGFVGGCGNEMPEENDIGLEMATEIDGLEFYESMKYGEDTETMENTKTLVDSETSVYDIYEAFLAGETAVCDKKTGEEKNISALLEAESGTYLYCDINGDLVDELHVKSDKHYYILGTEGTEFEILYEGAVYEQPVNEAGVCGVFYHREGAAPTHDSYQFHTFGLLGETSGSVSFEWYDNNENGKMEEEDLYLYDGSEMKMDEWIEKTERYRNLDVEDMAWEMW